MPFWNKFKKKAKKVEDKTDEDVQSQPENSEIYIPRNPYVTFELVDGVHLDVDMGWPLEADLSMFIKMLSVLNSGGLIGAQVAEATLYSNRVNEQGQAKAIYEALEPIIAGIKTEKDREKAKNKNKPVIHPSKVINHILKGSK